MTIPITFTWDPLIPFEKKIRIQDTFSQSRELMYISLFALVWPKLVILSWVLSGAVLGEVDTETGTIKMINIKSAHKLSKKYFRGVIISARRELHRSPFAANNFTGKSHYNSTLFTLSFECKLSFWKLISQHHIMKHSKGEKKYLVNAESKAKNEKAQTPWIFRIKKRILPWVTRDSWFAKPSEIC